MAKGIISFFIKVSLVFKTRPALSPNAGHAGLLPVIQRDFNLVQIPHVGDMAAIFRLRVPYSAHRASCIPAAFC
ncbi:hypothetical protein LF95_13075 [Thalassospira sp. TSL5-1]|nr:hypothetical protein LF95_13075 [Thalassospira sp. TSL5-1]